MSKEKDCSLLPGFDLMATDGPGADDDDDDEEEDEESSSERPWDQNDLGAG